MSIDISKLKNPDFYTHVPIGINGKFIMNLARERFFLDRNILNSLDLLDSLNIMTFPQMIKVLTGKAYLTGDFNKEKNTQIQYIEKEDLEFKLQYRNIFDDKRFTANITMQKLSNYIKWLATTSK